MFGLQMFSEMEGLHREMDQLFREIGFRPVSVNRTRLGQFRLQDKGESFEVSAPLPGIDVEKLDINVLERRLTLSGEFAAVELPEEASLRRRERSAGGFQRAITLPAAIDAEKVEAEYAHGILRITLPKAQSALPKKIAVKAH